MTRNKKIQDGMCILFCVPPSFVLIDNKYILSCTINVLYGANSPLNESSEELRMKQWCLYLHTFTFFQDYAIKAEIIWSYCCLTLEDQNKKNV